MENNQPNNSRKSLKQNWLGEWVVFIMKFILFLAIVLAAGYFVVKNNKKEKVEAGVVLNQGLPFPCVIEGTIDPPPHEDRIKARNIEAASKGIAITSDEAHNNSVQGGGGLDGGMYLVGAFKFTIDAQGQRVDAESFVNIFNVEYPITGGIEPSGKIGIGGDGGAGGTSITGAIVNGQLVNGRIHKGLKPHIFGVLNGTYKRTGAEMSKKMP